MRWTFSVPEPVLVERRDAVTVLRLNRPHRRNALDSATLMVLDRELTRPGGTPGWIASRRTDYENDLLMRFQHDGAGIPRTR